MPNKKDLYYQLRELEGQLNNYEGLVKDVKKEIDNLYYEMEEIEKATGKECVDLKKVIEQLEDMVYHF